MTTIAASLVATFVAALVVWVGGGRRLWRRAW